MSYEEEHGYEVFGQNLFEAANHDQKWIITRPRKDASGKQIEYLVVGTEFEARKIAHELGGTYRRATDAEAEKR